MRTFFLLSLVLLPLSARGECPPYNRHSLHGNFLFYYGDVIKPILHGTYKEQYGGKFLNSDESAKALVKLVAVQNDILAENGIQGPARMISVAWKLRKGDFEGLNNNNATRGPAYNGPSLPVFPLTVCVDSTHSTFSIHAYALNYHQCVSIANHAAKYMMSDGKPAANQRNIYLNGELKSININGEPLDGTLSIKDMERKCSAPDVRYFPGQLEYSGSNQFDFTFQ